jgi:hypothetical protein
MIRESAEFARIRNLRVCGILMAEFKSRRNSRDGAIREMVGYARLRYLRDGENREMAKFASL